MFTAGQLHFDGLQIRAELASGDASYLRTHTAQILGLTTDLDAVTKRRGLSANITLTGIGRLPKLF